MRRGCVSGSPEEQSVETVFVELGELALCLGFDQPFQTLLAKIRAPPPRLTAPLTSEVMVRVQELAGTGTRQGELKSIGRGQPNDRPGLLFELPGGELGALHHPQVEGPGYGTHDDDLELQSVDRDAMTVEPVTADHVEVLRLDPNRAPGHVSVHDQIDQTQNNTFLPQRLTPQGDV